MSVDDDKMDEYRVEFIKCALDAGALKFGSFTLKSGRQATVSLLAITICRILIRPLMYLRCYAPPELLPTFSIPGCSMRALCWPN